MKNNRWTRSLFVGIILVMLVSLSGCSAGDGRSQTKNNEMEAIEEGWSDDMDSAAIHDTTAGTEGSLGSGVPEGRKIIRNADLELETKDAKASYQQLLDWVTQNNGYEVEKYLHLNQNRNTIMATLHIPEEHLDEFLQMAGNTGDLLRQSTYSDDITSFYTDTELRAKSTRANLDAYYRLLDKAKTVEEIVSVQRAIDELTLQIESHQAMLNQWDEQLEFSRVSLTVAEPDPYRWLFQYGWIIIGGLMLIALVVLLYVREKRTQKRHDQMMQARQGMPWYQSGTPYHPGVSPQPGVPTQPDAPTPPGEPNQP